MAATVSSPSLDDRRSRLDLALLVLRVIVGIVFVVHGGQKLFQFGFGGVIDSFGKMGIPLPMVAGPVVTLVEFLGGLALVAGAFTRIAALLIALDMLGAILLVHLKHGFMVNEGGFEFALVLMGAAACLALAGAGAYSVDGKLRRRRLG